MVYVMVFQGIQIYVQLWPGGEIMGYMILIYPVILMLIMVIVVSISELCTFCGLFKIQN